MIFKTPLVLGLIPLLMIVFFWSRTHQKKAHFRFPSKELLHGLPSSWKIRCQFLPDLLRFLVLAVLLVALAGPRQLLQETVRKVEGIDIVLAIDISGSMLAEDFKIGNERRNRLEIVREVAKDFIGGRRYDRIGLVVFAGLAYTAVPLTTDHAWLKEGLERMEVGLIKDGTAIGSGIMASIDRLRQSKAKSKVVILLTDGDSNAGEVAPLSAARAAAAFGIKIYTIGVGSKGLVPFPATDMFGRRVYRQVRIDMDEETLKEIASLTKARYFFSGDTESLRNIYQEIDQLERTKIEETGFAEYEELYGKWLIGALVLLLLEIILARSVLLRVP